MMARYRGSNTDSIAFDTRIKPSPSPIFRQYVNMLRGNSDAAERLAVVHFEII